MIYPYAWIADNKKNINTAGLSIYPIQFNVSRILPFETVY